MAIKIIKKDGSIRKVESVITVVENCDKTKRLTETKVFRTSQIRPKTHPPYKGTFNNL